MDLADIYQLKPDRMVVFFDSSDSDWVKLRVVLFHFTVFKTDILDILDIVGVEVPRWLEYLINHAQKLEVRPIPEAPFPQTLPSIQTIRDKVSRVVEPGMAYPLFDGGQIAGLAYNPGGELIYQEIPFRAKLRSLEYLGLNFWLQSGLLNGAACLVSQVILNYQRDSLPRVVHPLIDLSEYVPGSSFYGAQIWHSPSLVPSGSVGFESGGYAHNEIIYYGGDSYYINRYYVADCPVPEYPNGHFMRPNPGDKLKISVIWGALGRARLMLEDDYEIGDSLDTVPFGCYPGWPSDDFLAPYGLTNNDSSGIHSLSDIVPISNSSVDWPGHRTTVNVLGDVVVEEEDDSGIRLGAGIIFAFPILAVSRFFDRQTIDLGAVPTLENEPLTVGSDPLTFGGSPLLFPV
jgi:hypothetical protein